MIGNNLLDGFADVTRMYTDMEKVYDIKGEFPLMAYLLYKDLHYQYPDSKFILNVRPEKDWIKSREHHDEGRYIKKFMKILNMTRDEVIDSWSNHFRSHIADVNNFFYDKPNRLLVFNISKDKPEKIMSFFSDIKFNIDDWKHLR